jgi:4'-phosphopantetheinyl transferase
VAVGIDLEIVEPRSAAFGRDYFTPAEADFIAAVAPQEQAAWVTCLWSAKEAVLKALGLGLRLDTRAVQISPRPEAVWEAGWQEMQVSGTAWSAAACRVWRRLEGAAVVTLAVIAPAVDLAKCEVIYAA